MAKKKTHRRQQSAAVAARPPLALLKGLGEADDLLKRKQPIEARQRLEALDQRYPGNADVLGLLVNANYDLKDTAGYQRAVARLAKLAPNDPDVLLGLAGAYMSSVRPALALRTFRTFLERFPDHPRAGEAGKTVADLEAAMQESLAEIGLLGAEGRAVAELHEEVQSALDQGDFAQVRRAAERLLALKPGFTPVLNNLGQAYMIEGKLDAAIATTQRALESDPGNVHALANLVIYHCRLGRLDEARAWAEQLKRSDRPAADKWTKVAEALSYLGDDAGVLEALRSGEREAEQLRSAGAVLFHLAAAAELRQGREAEAKRHWKRALKLNPGLDVASENLADLDKPAEARHAPWPFALGNWVTGQMIQRIAAQLAGKTRDQAIANATRRFLRQYPEVAAIVPLLLDRGDPQARQFALMLARSAGTPELLAALADFARSQRGPDQMRHEAAMAADQAGLLPDRRLKMWIKGAWTEIQLMGFEISGAPQHPFSPRVEALMIEATRALHAREGAKAERLLRQALEIEPDSPNLLNNLAMALGIQGDNQGAEAMIREIFERHPDYLFARVSVARMHMRDRDFAAAEELLKPLLSRHKLHTSEATTLFGAYVDFYELQGNVEAAKTWLDMWANIDPENPQIVQRQALYGAGDKLRNLIGRKR